MTPWGMQSDEGPVTAEKAISFISKSWLDVRKSADEDLKRMKARAKSFTDLANSFDRELENFRKASLNLGVDTNSGNLFRKFKDGGSLYAPLNMSQFEDLEFLKKLKPLSQFRRSHSNPDFVNQQNGTLSKLDLSLLRRALTPHVNNEDFYLKSVSDGEAIKSQRAIRNLAARRIVVRDWQLSKSKRGSKKTRPSSEGWDPLKRVRESWKDLEVTATSSKTPSEFFDNLKKTQLFQSVKKNLRFSSASLDDGRDVPPLDVPELLANLVRQSEPLLDQLGVKKDVAEKVCDLLQKCKRKEQLSTTNTDNAVGTRDSDKGADELELRIASVVQSTGYRYKGGMWGEQVTRDSEHGIRNVAIVTTASLPWMTGTAVNPLFRAAYLAKSGKQAVTLLVPWLCKNDQGLVYPNNMIFETPQEQEIYIRDWLEARVGFRPDFKLIFYPGKFHKEKRSILAAGDISRFIPDKEADIAVLEEPEHLNWYYHGKRWSDKFRHVVGVVHTNYLEYVKREKNGAFQAFLLKHVNNWVTQIYCHKVLRLSAATQDLPKSIVCNVHGVSPKFLEIGQKVAEGESGKMNFSKGAYFLGKMVWGKGYKELVDLLEKHKQDLQNLSVDVYGNGEDSAEVKAAAEKLGLSMRFHPGRDHADDLLHGYKVFINPSVSDVVCTTTAEALAMGKIVVCADHPSNEFFKSFPNCLVYKSSEEFVEKVNQAMASDPVPLSPEQQYLLSWEAATDRFIESAELDKPFKKGTLAIPDEIIQKKTMTLSLSMPNLSELVDNGLAFAHFCASGNEAARLISGAVPGTMNYDLEHSKDLHLPPPAVDSPFYGW